MSTDMSPHAITERLRVVARLSDLAPDKRLDAKLDLSARGITKRLREASDLLRACQTLGNLRLSVCHRGGVGSS